MPNFKHSVFQSMIRKKKKQHIKSGLPPGTAVFIGEQKAETTETTVVQYNDTSINVEILRGLDCPIANPAKVTWLDIRGLSDVSLIEHIGKTFNVHLLAIEDVLPMTFISLHIDGSVLNEITKIDACLNQTINI